MNTAAATMPIAAAGTTGIPASSIEQRDDDRAEHGDLSVREVEHAGEPVDQRQPDAEQPILQPEHDAVEDRRSHATPRYARVGRRGCVQVPRTCPTDSSRPFSST